MFQNDVKNEAVGELSIMKASNCIFKNNLIYTIGVFYPNEVTFMDTKLEAYKTLNKYINKSPKKFSVFLGLTTLSFAPKTIQIFEPFVSGVSGIF